MHARFCKRLGLGLALISPAAPAAVTYHTIDVTAAIGHGGSFVDGYIRGAAGDSDLVNDFGLPASVANPGGSLSYNYLDNLPFGQADVAQLLSATSTWDTFVVTGNSVGVRDFTFDGAIVQTSGHFWDVRNLAGATHTLTATLDGRLTVSWTGESIYTGPFAPWTGALTEHDYSAVGGYVLNEAATGLQTASAAQFETLGPGHDALAADYLNFVAANHLPANWTQAGLWLFAGDFTPDNTRGFFAGSLIGGSYIGYNVWYSTDTFVYGQPIPDADSDGLFSLDEGAGDAGQGHAHDLRLCALAYIPPPWAGGHCFDLGVRGLFP